jgi:hypothetical protein
MKLARGENIAFEIAFLELMTVYPTLNITLGGNNLEFSVRGGGVFRVSTPAAPFEPGDYVISIAAEKEFTDTVVQTIDVKILDYWATSVELIDPPTVYPWNNISSFVFRYYCSDSPRSGLILANAEITALNITYVGAEGEISERYLTTADIARNVWNWTNLASNSRYGPGYYLVWVNTSILTINEGKFYYLIATINQSIYAQIKIRPYVWVTPVESQVTVLAGADSITSETKFDRYLDQSLSLYVRLNVTDINSILLTNTIDDADVGFDLYNGLDYIYSGDLEAVGNGIYRAELPAITIGTFTIEVFAFKQNFTIKAATFNYIVAPKPIILSQSLGVSKDFTITIPQNRPYEFHLDLFDHVANTTLTGATMNVTIGSTVYTFYEHESIPGRYVAKFSAEEVAKFAVDTYPGYIEVFKTNYTSYVMTFSFVVSFPVDPVFNFPLPYWRMGFIVASVMAAAYVVQKSIRYARIPLYIKQVDATIKAISKKKSLVSDKIAPELNDEICQKYGYIWDLLDLDMKSIIKPKEESAGTGDFMSPSDQPNTNETQGGDEV